MNSLTPDPNREPHEPAVGSAAPVYTGMEGRVTRGRKHVSEEPGPFKIIEGRYLQDILEQPDALRNALAGLAESTPRTDVARKLNAGEFQRVVLTGMGTSLHALYPLHLALSRHGLASFWIETAELLLGFEALFRPDTLLVVVSQSGESAEIVNLLSRAAAFGHVLGITNREGSRLGRQAGSTVLLRAGVESSVSCKSYLTTLAVLHWLRALLCQGDLAGALRDLRPAERGVRSYLTHWREHVNELITLTDGIQSIFVTGRGESLATANAAGLILKESTRHPAEGMSCAAFRHGPMEMAGSGVLVLIYAGDKRVSHLNRRLAEDIIRNGGRALRAAQAGVSRGAFKLPKTIPALQPIVEILPVQMLSLALAARDGREAGRFERASKTTTIA